jgi:hypothetical protein
VVCDASYSSARWLALIRALSAGPVVRPNPTHRTAPPHDHAAYRRRWRTGHLAYALTGDAPGCDLERAERDIAGRLD